MAMHSQLELSLRNIISKHTKKLPQIPPPEEINLAGLSIEEAFRLSEAMKIGNELRAFDGRMFDNLVNELGDFIEQRGVK